MTIDNEACNGPVSMMPVTFPGKMDNFHDTSAGLLEIQLVHNTENINFGGYFFFATGMLPAVAVLLLSLLHGFKSIWCDGSLL